MTLSPVFDSVARSASREDSLQSVKSIQEYPRAINVPFLEPTKTNDSWIVHQQR